MRRFIRLSFGVEHFYVAFGLFILAIIILAFRLT